MIGRASDAGSLHENLDDLRRQSHRGQRIMRMQFLLPGGDLEYAILAKLWELGSASARDIHTQMGEPEGLVYTTTAKVLDRLHIKRLVSRERKGLAFLYRPRVARALVDNARARQLLTKLF